MITYFKPGSIKSWAVCGVRIGNRIFPIFSSMDYFYLIHSYSHLCLIINLKEEKSVIMIIIQFEDILAEFNFKVLMFWAMHACSYEPRIYERVSCFHVSSASQCPE